ncbi:serine/threonine-protein kinase [Paraliomyxa miuraensis]|uniref:serine/threonine-protein kinase n=1 Tax=Paraliomyxa miuraensis TaxID=376150 RepID=UPI0022551F50|nr:serine/threonine-protein kinase [Paraliomyxa miuraensis]MCX4246595.1 serine/threonine protein kinase [Paraliomyxa miuraensis]
MPPTQRGPLPDLLPAGTRLAKHYVIHERLGGGGMASVYRGEHTTIGRPVAIKVLSRSLCLKPAVVVRFLQEARASSKVRHENVVEVTDFGETEDGRPFMVMEYLEGENLAVTLRREGPLPWDRTRPMLLQLLAALQAAHEHGVIHRDMKPENVFRISRMGSDDFLKVFDFGIAKVLLGDDGNPAKPLTIEGQILGTPAYMAPEQCLGDAVDARTDLYAVGVIAFQMLTGRPPFEGDETSVLLYNQVYTRVPDMREVAPSIPVNRGVEALVRKALAKDRDDRFETAQEFAEALLADDNSSSGLLPMLRGLFRRRR